MTQLPDDGWGVFPLADGRRYFRRRLPAGGFETSRFLAIPDYSNGCTHTHSHTTDTGHTICSWCHKRLDPTS